MNSVLFGFLLAAQVSVPDPADTDGRVFELIKSYQANQERVFAQGFAFYATGECEFKYKDLTWDKDRMYLCVYEGPGRRLDVVGTENQPKKYIGIWQSQLIYNGGVTRRPTMDPLRRSPFELPAPNQPFSSLGMTAQQAERERDKRKEKEKREMHIPQPLRYGLGGMMGFRSWTDVDSRSSADHLLSGASTLMDSAYTRDGDVRSVFKGGTNIPGKTTKKTILFSKSQGFFPVIVTNEFGSGDDWRKLSEAEITWSKHETLFVPRRIKYASYPIGKTSRQPSEHFDIEFDWRIGDEVTAKIDPIAPDWRQRFKDMFDADWRVKFKE